MTVVMILVFMTAALIGFAVIPMAYSTSVSFGQKRAHLLSNRLDRMMPRKQINNILQLYIWGAAWSDRGGLFSY